MDKFMKWVPRIKWVPLTPAEAIDLDLPDSMEWDGLVVAWGDYEFGFMVRERDDGVDA